MKAGDKVTVRAGSWSKKIRGGKLISALTNRSSIRGQHWTVIETDCVFPLTQGYYGQPSQYRNDTVIQGPGGVDDIVFIHSGSLKLVPPPKPKHVWVDGDLGVDLDGEIIVLAHCNRSSQQHYIVLNGDDVGVFEEWDDVIDAGCNTFLFNIKTIIKDKL